MVNLRVLSDTELFPGVHGIHGKLFEKAGGNHILACSFNEGKHYNSKSSCNQRPAKILEIFTLKC